MPRPSPQDCASFYQPYILNTNATEPIVSLSNAFDKLKSCLTTISDQKSSHKYAPEKWSIKEIIQHLIDTERIFAYRALSIARGDFKMASFDQDIYVKKSNADYRVWKELVDEFYFVRESSMLLFKSFDNSMLNAIGEMGNHPVTVNALGFIIAGHQNHHIKVIEEKYL